MFLFAAGAPDIDPCSGICLFCVVMILLKAAFKGAKKYLDD